MGWLKQLGLSWTILVAAAACVSCQELRSTLREGNYSCPGEEVTFTCTVRGPSSLSVLILGWSSDEYIGQGRSLQLSTANTIGHIEISTGMDGSITATATVTNKTNVNGERILESTLRITAVEASTVTCSGTSGGTESMVRFSISAVPGVPRRIDAAEISRPRDNICIILVTWDPPTNGDASDIAQYIVYVPSRNIRNNILSSTLTTLTVPNCGSDIRVQVAAVSRIGCVGMNSSEVQLILLDIPTAPTVTGSATTGDRSATTERGSATSTVATTTIAVLTVVIIIVLVAAIILVAVVYYQKVTDVKKIAKKTAEYEEKITKETAEYEKKTAEYEEKIAKEAAEYEKKTAEHEEKIAKEAAENARENFISSLGSLYDALIQNKISSMQVAVRQLLGLEKKMPCEHIKEALKTVLESEITSAIGVRLVFRQLRKKIPKIMSAIDDELPVTGKLAQILSKEPHEELKEPKRGKVRKISVMGLIEAGEALQESFGELKKELVNASSQRIKDHLQKLFQALQNTEAENSEMAGHGLQEVFVAMADEVGKAPPERVKRYLQEFMKNLQDASDSDLSLPPTFGPPGLTTLHENKSQDDDTKEGEDTG